jgi:hypothetical protein
MSVRSRTTREMGAGGVSDSQLRLLPGGSRPGRSTRPDWQLDERTRSVGRLGVAQAREALRPARPPEPKQPEPVRKAS